MTLTPPYHWDFSLDLQFRNYLLIHVMFGLLITDMNRFLSIKWIHFKKVNFALLFSTCLLIVHLMVSKHVVLMPFNHIGLKWFISVLAMLSAMGFRYGFIEEWIGRSFFTVPKVINEIDPHDNDMVLPEGVLKDIKIPRDVRDVRDILNEDGEGKVHDVVRLIRKTRSIYWVWYVALFATLVGVYPTIMHFSGCWFIDPDRVLDNKGNVDTGSWWYMWVAFSMYVFWTVVALTIFGISIYFYVASYKRGEEDIYETTKGALKTSTEFLNLGGKSEEMMAKKKAWWYIRTVSIVYFGIAFIYMVFLYHAPLLITFIIDSYEIGKGRESMKWWTAKSGKGGKPGDDLAAQYWEILFYGIPVLILSVISLIVVFIAEARQTNKRAPEIYEVDEK